MPPSRWDEEDEESTPPSSPPPAIVRRSKFDDEEDEDDVLESWDAADDSDAEREKAKKEAEAKAAAEAKAKASHKSKSQRIEEHRMEKMRARAAAEEEDDDSDESDEDETERRARLLREQKESDMKHAEDLFAGIGVSDKRAQGKAVTVMTDASDPTKTVELSSLSLFDPQTREQFLQLRETIAPLITKNAKKAQYAPFMAEFSKELMKDLPSEQIKKIASSLTAMSNEKLKEEKAADKGGKKSKAAKTKTTLNASRNPTASADTNAYDDGLDEDDFM